MNAAHVRPFAFASQKMACMAVMFAALCAGVAPAHAGENDDADLVVLDGGFAQVSLRGLLQTQFLPLLGDDARLVSGDPADAPGM
ncbi:MAG TPA: hypothetical protein PK095_09810, partial [Myxococcota bacterium]|nr:hypothetical protein [Myxococcota bacterium]